MSRRALRPAAVMLLLIAALMVAGCSARSQLDVEMDRTGRGTATVRVDLDRDALRALGLSASDPAGAAARLQAFLDDPGWGPADGGQLDVGAVAVSGDEKGGLTFRSRTAFGSVAELDAILGRRRDLRALAGPEAARMMAGLPDLPASTPLVNDFSLRLGAGRGDSPGFTLFGRGGVGEIGQQTCQGDRATGASRRLRDAVQLRYRFVLPGGPGQTNADETPGGENVWDLRYEDCDALRATAGGGNSSTLFNGIVLAALSTFLIAVFLVRGVRRRRAHRTR